MLKKLKPLKKPLFQKRRWSCDFPPRKTPVAQKHRAISRQEKIAFSTPPPRQVVLELPSPSRRDCADGRTYGWSRDYYVTTKISRIDRLPNLLSNGAPLAGFVAGSAISIKSKYNVNSWKKHSLGVGYPSSCNISLAINKANLNELKGKASPLEAMLEKQTNIREEPTSIHRMKKPHRARCGNNGEKSRPYGQHFPTCRARSGYEPKLKARQATYWTN